MPSSYDVVIIGGGIVGLSTAYALSRQQRGVSIAVIEKEERLMAHQSSHNSGVIHSGIYYTPGSLKARLCQEGRRRLLEFCEREGVPYELCGKVIVATHEEERPRLRAIYERGRRNGIDCTMVDVHRLRELEPHVAGVEAIYVPEAGIIDYEAVGQRLRRLLSEHGHHIQTGTEAQDLVYSNGTVVVETTQGALHARTVVNCAGLYADQIARMSGLDPEIQIIPFRGEYYTLTRAARTYCRNLIYPTPDPTLPFLGVHFTRTIAGEVECGPSAVLAFAREGYRLGHVDLRELFRVFTYPGFLRLAQRHYRTGIVELARSLSKRAYLRAAQQLIPAVQAEDLLEGHAGVRAQAVTRSGKLVDDFLILESDRVVNVCNAPSPAATSSLAIGDHIAQRVAARE